MFTCNLQEFQVKLRFFYLSSFCLLQVKHSKWILFLLWFEMRTKSLSGV